MRIYKQIVFVLFLFLSIVLAQNSTQKPYVLIVSLDGFRWDYLDRGITPNLQQMAEQGVRAIGLEPVFPSKTFPNHYSIATGMYPPHHGLINNSFYDPFTKQRYRLGDTSAVRNAYWYKGEALWETAQRQGILSASFFWPGSEVHLTYRHPQYFKRYDGSISHAQRIQGIIDWLQLPEEQRPHLLFLYFSDTDTYGHRYGPESEEINQAIALLDHQIGVLQAKIDSIGLAEQVNLIVLSDHGMTPLRADGQILLYKLLEGLDVKMDGYGPLVQFSTKTAAQTQTLVQRLNQHRRHFTVYQKEDIPAHFHYRQSPFIGDVIAVADPGYTFVRTPAELEKVRRRATRGDHGYDNHLLDMQGIFVASGPAFKKGYQCRTLRNIDVYPLVCKILGIVPNGNIDGQLEQIEFVLQ